MSLLSKKIAEIRLLVGFLGEKNQANWWSSEFLSANSSAFLAPIFNRSLFLAQYQGVTAAAAKVHDETIGIGRIYHLFRLPIGLEQASAEVLNDTSFVQEIQTQLASRELALSRLESIAEQQVSASPGPMYLGEISQDLMAGLTKAAGLYCAGFTSEIQTFPYFREVE